MRVILLLSSILVANLLQAQDFDVIEATSQKWTGGRARSGHGINYKLTIVCKKKLKKVHFEKLWVGEEAFELKIAGNEQNESNYSKKDTIVLTARKKVNTNEYGDEIKVDKKKEVPPVDFITEALFNYKVRGKGKHIFVDKLKKLKAIYYP